MINLYRSLFILGLLAACTPLGILTFEADISNSLKEVSAIEPDLRQNSFWVIEDSGNPNILYQLNSKGKIISSIRISNAKNKDWEDLSVDANGNLYIGDIGNNNGKRNHFQIYKIRKTDLLNSSVTAEIIEFTISDEHESKDMEGFFVFKDHFYLFTKESKKASVFKVPNAPGKHEAQLLSRFKLDGKNTKITSAAIHPNYKTVVLLNHNKLWKLTEFEADDFFGGRVERIDFGHDSQKEGIGFGSNHKVYITDERNGSEGGNIYSHELRP